MVAALVAVACAVFGAMSAGATSIDRRRSGVARGSSAMLEARSLARSRLPAEPAGVSLSGESLTIPPSFLGLSIEYNELSSYESAGTLFDRVISLLGPGDGTGMLLRVGGMSADDAYWETPTTTAPAWVFAIGAGWLSELSALVQRDRLQVILDLNLAVHSPALAASFARAAAAALPAGSLAGFEIGNEPDLYWHQPGLQRERIASTIAGTPFAWTVGYAARDYVRDYRAYARTLLAAAPGVPLAGPATAAASAAWLAALNGLGASRPRIITTHRYPLSNCWPIGSRFYPTIPALLADGSSAGLAASLQGTVAYVRRSHLTLRLDEMNSVSCGGKEGVANSFASALWALDALFEMMRAGVDAVNWHIRPGTLNAPFHLVGDGIDPLPELYGLAVFAQMLRTGNRLLGVHTTESSDLHLKVWALGSRRGLSVLVINEGPRAARVTLDLGRTAGPALLRRLTAPTVSSSSGVTFGGRSIGADALWHGADGAALARSSGSAYQVLVPGYSAALVSPAPR
jgi:hypothetical protein